MERYSFVKEKTLSPYLVFFFFFRTSTIYSELTLFSKVVSHNHLHLADSKAVRGVGKLSDGK